MEIGNYMTLNALSAYICCLHQEMDCAVQDTALIEVPSWLCSCTYHWGTISGWKLLCSRILFTFWWYFVQAIKQLHRI